jgi:hypothetical protein
VVEFSSADSALFQDFYQMINALYAFLISAASALFEMPNIS